MSKRKNRHTRQPRIYPAALYMDFLHEINRVLPNIEVPEQRASVHYVQSLFRTLHHSALMSESNREPSTTITERALKVMIETLRCCGIAPSRWPQPPGPDELLRCHPVKLSFIRSNEQGGTTP